MENLIAALVTLLRDRQVTIADQSGAEARALKAQQASLYDTFVGAFREVKFKNGSVGASALATSVFQAGRKLLDGSELKISKHDKEHIIVGVLPILRDDDVVRLREIIRSGDEIRPAEEARQLPIIVAAALIVETTGATKAPLIRSEEVTGQDGLFLLVQINRYLAVKMDLHGREVVDARYREEMASIGASMLSYRADFEKERAEQRAQLDVLSSAGADIDERSQKAIEALDGFRNDLVNHEAAIREEWKLDRARLNWNARFREARLGFQIACGLLAVYLATTLFVAIFYGAEIVESVNHFDVALFLSGGSVGTAIAHQFSRLVVFSVPIVVYLWVLKAVMRYFMRSLLLMDDARQRETMLDTYFLLTEKGRADERDRPLILWALFRQTPGHGPDGIEPPDFTEVINAGFNRAKSSGAS